mmetsp:Transcript_53009/g.103701  ORF Transcript_53009/g.103701 Transcript_53009/m.103701 type:complete len:139 (+) Transcript_53009:454-870(+)
MAWLPTASLYYFNMHLPAFTPVAASLYCMTKSIEGDDELRAERERSTHAQVQGFEYSLTSLTPREKGMNEVKMKRREEKNDRELTQRWTTSRPQFELQRRSLVFDSFCFFAISLFICQPASISGRSWRQRCFVISFTV